MITHIKYNYRFTKDGLAICDWFTVGESLDYQDMEITVDSIHMDWQSNSAEVSVHDVDNNHYIITQQNIYQVLNNV